MPGVIDRYRDRLPVAETTPVVTLGEGSTPLLEAPRLSARLNCELWLKWEGANPTGSFKDRGMTVAISKAVESGVSAVICASTGNTAASAAAYAARAGLRAVVLQPHGAVTGAKVAQAAAVGARVVQVRGSFDDALTAARVLSDRGTHALVNSLNPFRLEGQKTAAFEIEEDLGGVPDLLALPYGGGGNTRAYALGFREGAAGMPRLLAGEALNRRETFASAIRIASPAHAEEATAAIDASGGRIVSLSDDAILSAWRLLAREEGLLCEPSSAAGLAAVIATGVEPGSRVVCVVTGHGLKDPETAARESDPPVVVEADPDAIAEAAA